MKLVKLSLAAIMAVGALSTANAQPLEEAIKGVEFSGFARYRLNDLKLDQGDAAGTSGNDYDVLTKFVAPVTEDLKFTAAIRAKMDASNKTAGAATPDYAMSKAFFTYAKSGLTVKAGLQAIPTPLNDSGYAGDRGTGIVAMYAMDKVTFAGAYFGSGSLSSDDNAFNGKKFKAEVQAAAVIASLGPVNAQLWALRAAQNTVDSSLFLQVDGKVAGFALMGQVINTKVDEQNKALANITDTSGMFYGLKAGYAMDNFAFNAGYTMNDDEQPYYTLNPDGKVIFPGWRLGYKSTNEADTDTMFADAGASFGKVGVKIGYAEAKYGNKHIAQAGENTKADKKDKEIWGQVSYKYAKNFNTYVKYSDLNSGVDAEDQKYFRFEAKYSF